MNAPVPSTLPTPSALQPADALDLWSNDPSVASPSPLAVLRIDGNERLLIPFTTSMVRCPLHFLDYPTLRGYVHCNGRDCLLCQIGRQPEVRDLWPVYDALDRVVGVLPISTNLRGQAMRPLITPVLRQLKEAREPMVIAIRRLDMARYDVRSFPLPADVDNGATVIQAFTRQMESSSVDLAGVYPRMANDDLAGLPEVATALKLKGIVRS